VIISLFDTFIPLIDLALFSSLITLLMASAMMRNRKEEIGYPFLRPLKSLKNLEGTPFY